MKAVVYETNIIPQDSSRYIYVGCMNISIKSKIYNYKTSFSDNRKENSKIYLKYIVTSKETIIISPSLGKSYILPSLIEIMIKLIGYVWRKDLTMKLKGNLVKSRNEFFSCKHMTKFLFLNPKELLTHLYWT